MMFLCVFLILVNRLGGCFGVSGLHIVCLVCVLVCGFCVLCGFLAGILLLCGLVLIFVIFVIFVIFLCIFVYCVLLLELLEYILCMSRMRAVCVCFFYFSFF